LPVADVIETLRPMVTETLAGAPVAVAGMAIIRGMPLPVVELGALLDGRRSEHAQRLVTVRTGRGQVALAVDSVMGLRNISRSSFRDLPPLLGGADTHAVSAIGALDAELLLLLNAARLVPDDTGPTLDTDSRSL
jgi:purine-binding chemotaxis protein CheW